MSYDQFGNWFTWSITNDDDWLAEGKTAFASFACLAADWSEAKKTERQGLIVGRVPVTNMRTLEKAGRVLRSHVVARKLVFE